MTDRPEARSARDGLQRAMIVLPVTLCSLLLSTGAAAAPSDVDVLRKLFPSAAPKGDRLVNVVRQGAKGFLPLDTVRSTRLDEKHRVIAFQLDLKPGPDSDMEDIDQQLLLAVIVVEHATGRFVGKPAGFPRESLSWRGCKEEKACGGFILRNLERVAPGIVAIAWHADNNEDSESAMLLYFTNKGALRREYLTLHAPFAEEGPEVVHLFRGLRRCEKGSELLMFGTCPAGVEGCEIKNRFASMPLFEETTVLHSAIPTEAVLRRLFTRFVPKKDTVREVTRKGRVGILDLDFPVDCHLGASAQRVIAFGWKPEGKKGEVVRDIILVDDNGKAVDHAPGFPQHVFSEQADGDILHLPSLDPVFGSDELIMVNLPKERSGYVRTQRLLILKATGASLEILWDHELYAPQGNSDTPAINLWDVRVEKGAVVGELRCRVEDESICLKSAPASARGTLRARLAADKSDYARSAALTVQLVAAP